MRSEERIVSAVAAALEQEKQVNLHRFPLQLEFDAGILTMEGEVEQIMAKKRALEVAAAIPGVSAIVDRIHLVPAAPMADGEIRDHLEHALLAESMLDSCAVWVVTKGTPVVVREADEDVDGSIDIEVADGIVILNGAVSSLSAKRLAGVLAWWVPGVRDVVNGIAVVAADDDNDDEIIDAVRLVLEKDPFVNAAQIRVSCQKDWVTLDGLVKNRAIARLAEADAWYVFGVDGVTNRLEVEV